MTAISVRGLRKSYRGRTAVDGIDLTVEPGEVFALLGPNGAGKTTTVEILEGHRRRDAGEVRVLGADPGTAGRRWPPGSAWSCRSRATPPTSPSPRPYGISPGAIRRRAIRSTSSTSAA